MKKQVFLLLLSFLVAFASSLDQCEFPGLRESFFVGTNSRLYPPPPTRVTLERKPFYNWGTGAPHPDIPADYFAVRWDGQITFPETGQYTFHITQDDGFRFFIGNGLSATCEFFFFTPLRVTNCTYTATAGTTLPFRFDYFELEKDARIEMRWKTPLGSSLVEVPLNVFKFNNCTIKEPVITKTTDIATGVDGVVKLSLSSRPLTNVTLELSSDCFYFSECRLNIPPNMWDVNFSVKVYQNPASTQTCCPVYATGVDGDADFFGKVKAAEVCIKTTISQAYSFGDPHLKTFDGVKYDFFDIGDFYFLRDLTGELVVQVRQEPCAGASCNYAVAIKYRTVILYLFLTADGLPSQQLVGNADALGVVVARNGDTFTFFAPNGARIETTVGYWEARNVYYFTVVAWLPSTFYNRVNGQAGLYDGNPDNDLSFNGTVYASGPAFARIWKVKNLENLFISPAAVIPPLNATLTATINYASCVDPPTVPGTITENIKNTTNSPLNDTTPPFDPNYTPIDDCQVFTDPILHALALATCSPPFNSSEARCCSDLGVPGDDYFANCLCDFNVVKGGDFVDASVGAFFQSCEAAALRLNASCKPCPFNCRGNGNCVDGVCNCASGFHGDSCGEDWNPPPGTPTLDPPSIPADCPPTTLTLTGQAFYGEALQCQFGASLFVPATKVTNFLLTCPIPTGLQGSVVEVRVVRSDGVASLPAQLTRFVSCCSNPCLNGGLCVGAPSSPVFTCQCPANLYPPNCVPCTLQVPPAVSAVPGADAKIEVKLTQPPTSNVQVEVSTACAYVSKCTLTFTPLNWNVSQTVAASQIASKPVASCPVFFKTSGNNACGNLNATTTVTFTTLRPTRGVSYGDPHIITYDELRYDHFAVGDYVVTRDFLGEFVIQARQEECARASCNYALAIKFRSTIYYIYIDKSGNPQTSLLGNPQLDGVSITYEAPNYWFYTPTGIKASVSIGHWAEMGVHYLFLTSYVVPAYAGKMAGLLGNYNGDKTDEYLQSSGVLTPKPDVFTDSWKTPLAQNLFVDASAVIPPIFGATVSPVTVSLGCSNYTDPKDISGPIKDASPPNSPLEDTPPPTQTLPPFDCKVFASEALRQAAILSCNDALNTTKGRCCEAAGVPLGDYLATCLCDYNLAQGPAFTAGVASTFFSDCIDVAPQCGACPENCNNHGTCSNGVCTCFPNFGGPTCGEDQTAPPVIDNLTPDTFDFRCAGSSRLITVSGQNFFGTSLFCVFPSATVPAVKLSNFQLTCVLPASEPVAPSTTISLKVKRGSVQSNAATASVVESCCINPCLHGSCVDTPSGFSCNCTGTGYTGNLCETLSVCPPSNINGAQLPSIPNFSTGSYSCPDGSVLSASSTCQGGSLTPPAISCVPAPTQTCPLSSSSSVIWPKTFVGSWAFGICREGYTGEPTRLCKKDGSWDSNVSNPCQIVRCPAVNESHASWEAADAFVTVTGKCAAGYLGNPTRTCTSSGVFGPISNPCLSPVTCAAVNFDNANFPVTNGGELSVGVCKEGYSGLAQRTCNADGTWGAVVSSCTRNRCLATVLDGITWPSVQSFERSYGICSGGTGGKPYRDCNADGSWGPVMGSCFACQGEFYARATWPATPGGEKAVGICEAGWTGSPERQCFANGAWNGALNSFCERLYCPLYTDSMHTFGPMVAGSQAYGSCLPGFKGRPWRKCNLDGNYGPIQNPCVAI